MNPSEAATVLAVAVTLDPRLKPPSREDAQARAVAWSQTLDPDMDVKTAQALVAVHYRESTDGLMPAHVNRLWRERRRSMAEQKRLMLEARAATEADTVAIPMPEAVREQWQRVLGGTRCR
jgi:hypothetical protein